DHPQAAADHPLSLLSRRARRARVPHSRVWLQGRNAPRDAERRHPWRSVISGPARDDGPRRARAQPEDAEGCRRGDDGRFHLSRRCRQALRGRESRRRGGRPSAEGCAIWAKLLGQRPRGASLVLHEPTEGDLSGVTSRHRPSDRASSRCRRAAQSPQYQRQGDDQRQGGRAEPDIDDDLLMVAPAGRAGSHWNNRVPRAPGSRQNIGERRRNGLIHNKPERELELRWRETKPRPKKTDDCEKDALKNSNEMRREREARNGKVRNGEAQQDGEKKKSDADLKKALRLARLNGCRFHL